MSVKYRIDIFKDGRQIVAKFDVRVEDIASDEFLGDFRLTVDDENLVRDFMPRNKEFVGSRYSTLRDPTKDAIASFDIATNAPWSDSGSDTLRGARLRDDCSFGN